MYFSILINTQSIHSITNIIEKNYSYKKNKHSFNMDKRIKPRFLTNPLKYRLRISILHPSHMKLHTFTQNSSIYIYTQINRI